MKKDLNTFILKKGIWADFQIETINSDFFVLYIGIVGFFLKKKQRFVWEVNLDNYRTINFQKNMPQYSKGRSKLTCRKKLMGWALN